MPNWCHNQLHIRTADKPNRLKRLVKQLRSPDGLAIDFNNHVPMPGAGEISDAISWACAHWGTKWNASDPELLEHNDTHATYGFSTAWCPPVEWITAVAEKYPELDFNMRSSEGGDDWAAEFTFNQGVLQETLEYTYREAMITWYGECADTCDWCGADFTATEMERPEPAICGHCETERCIHCQELREDHANSKCLFDATVFKATVEKV